MDDGNRWQGWHGSADGKQSEDFRDYRDELVVKTLQVVANWRRQRTQIGKKNKNLAYLCSRLDLLVEGAGATALLPPPSSDDTETLIWRLSDLLTMLAQTNCWDLH